MDRGPTELTAVLDRFVAALQQQLPISQVILYGSHVRGEANELSDINLVVISPQFGKNKLQEIRLLSQIALDCDEDIEALPYSLEDLENLIPGSFLDEVLRTGRVIYREP
ncbi:MAG: nucleotidyltransferase domain-containing protein [Bacillota bacterium]|jgi:predicted nucleotidyltransferase